MSAPTAQKPAAPSPRIDPDGHIEPEEKVTPLELFFDLVFVFAITQVTSLLSHDPTWQGLGRGLLVLCAIWWAWVAYSWLTNTIDPEEGVARIGIGGGVGQGPEGYAGHVTFYVEVPDVEASLAQAESLGGERVMGPEKIMEGVEIGQFRDPQGNVIGVIKGG